MKCKYCGTINDLNNIKCISCNAFLLDEDAKEMEEKEIVEKKYDIDKGDYVMHVIERGYSKITMYEAKTFKGEIRLMLPGLFILCFFDIIFFLVYYFSENNSSSTGPLILLIILLCITIIYVIFEVKKARKKFPNNTNH